MNFRIYCGRLFLCVLFYCLAITSVKAQCSLPTFNDWQNINRFTYDGNWLMNGSGAGWASTPPQRNPVTTTTDDFGISIPNDSNREYIFDSNFLGINPLLPNNPIIRVGKKFNQLGQGELSPVRRAAVVTFNFTPTVNNSKVRVYYLGMLQQYSTSTTYYDAAAANFRLDQANSSRQAASFGLFCRYNYTSPVPTLNSTSFCGQTEFGLSGYNSGSNTILPPASINLKYGYNDMFSFYQAGTSLKTFPANPPGNTSLNKKMTTWDNYVMDFSEFINTTVTITLFANTSNLPGDTQNHSYCYYQFECLNDLQTPPLQSTLLDIGNKDLGCGSVLPTNINVNITDTPPTLLSRIAPLSSRVNNNTSHQWLHLPDVVNTRYANNFATLKLQLANSSNVFSTFTNFKALAVNNTADANIDDIQITALPATPSFTEAAGSISVYRFKAIYATRNNPTPQEDIFEFRFRLITTAPTTCVNPSVGEITATSTAGPVTGSETSICKPATNSTVPQINLSLGAATCANVSYRWQKRESSPGATWTTIAGATGVNLTGAQNEVGASSCFTQFRRVAVTTNQACVGTVEETLTPSDRIFTIRNYGYIRYTGSADINYTDWQTGLPSSTPTTGLVMTSGIGQVAMCYGNTANFNFTLNLGEAQCGVPVTQTTTGTVQFYSKYVGNNSSISNVAIGTPFNYSYSGDTFTTTIPFSYQALNQAGVLNLNGSTGNQFVTITMVLTGTRGGCPFTFDKEFVAISIYPRGIGGAIVQPVSSCPSTVENDSNVLTMSFDATGAGNSGYTWQYCTQYTTTGSTYSCTGAWTNIPNQNSITLNLLSVLIPRPFIVRRVAQAMNNCVGTQVQSNSVLIDAPNPLIVPNFTLPTSFCKNGTQSIPIPLPVSNPAIAGNWCTILYNGNLPPGIGAPITSLDLGTMSAGVYSYIFVPTVNPFCYELVIWTFNVYDTPTLTGTQVLSPGDTSQLSSNTSGGTYTSSNTLVATVNANNGLVTAVSNGITTIRYTTAGGCYTELLITVQNCAQSTTWDGTSWDHGVPNTPAYLNTAVIFNAGAYNSTQDLYACSLKVEGTAAVTMKHLGVATTTTASTFTVKNEVTVVTGASLIFEDDASLVQQVDGAVNSGNIIYKRTTPPIKQFDYVYWCSPVVNQILSGLTEVTNPGLIYHWNAASGSWVYTNNTNLMDTGKGYIVRAPNSFGDNLNLQGVNFNGVPNNGTLTTPLAISGTSKMNLIGNPYPSGLDINCFLAANPNLGGTLYFWTHNIPIDFTGNTPGNGVAIYNYNVNSYVAYNQMGSLSAGIDANGLCNTRPKGVIGAGQSFFIEANSSGVATFNNSMRVGSQNQENSQFYKTTAPVANIFSSCDPSPPSRLWLNLRNLSTTPQDFKQTLVGYSPNATTSVTIDRGYDGLINTPLSVLHDFYSLSPGNDKLTIQGHYTNGTTIDIADVFPLGISCKKNTLVTNAIEISVCDFDGLFNSTSFYLRETLASGLHTYYDIRTTPYVFNITGDIVDNTSRFAIVFDNTLPKMSALNTAFTVTAAPNPFTNGFQLGLKTKLSEVVQVELYDVLGKLVEKQTLSADALKNHIFGKQLSTGFYTALVSQGGYKEAVKVIKK